MLAKAEANDFYSGLNYYLKQSCKLNFSGKVFPYSTEVPPKKSEISIDISGYKTGSYLQKDNILKTGSIIDGRWRIKNLSWKHKNSVPVQAYLFREQKYKLVIGRIELLSEIIPEAQPTKAFELPLYQFDILFLLNPVTHVVETCQVMFEDEKICESLYAIYDPSTGTCLLNQNCFFKQMVNNCIPDPDSDIPNTGNSICHEVLQSYKYIKYYSKDKDGYFASCPSE